MCVYIIKLYFKIDPTEDILVRMTGSRRTCGTTGNLGPRGKGSDRTPGLRTEKRTSA